MSEKRISWEEKNNAYFAYNASGERLGWLEYARVGQWMKWVWYQENAIFMSPGCLQEVRDKQKELSNKDFKDVKVAEKI